MTSSSFAVGVLSTTYRFLICSSVRTSYGEVMRSWTLNFLHLHRARREIPILYQMHDETRPPGICDFLHLHCQQTSKSRSYLAIKWYLLINQWLREVDAVKHDSGLMWAFQHRSCGCGLSETTNVPPIRVHLAQPSIQSLQLLNRKWCIATANAEKKNYLLK